MARAPIVALLCLLAAPALAQEPPRCAASGWDTLRDSDQVVADVARHRCPPGTRLDVAMTNPGQAIRLQRSGLCSGCSHEADCTGLYEPVMEDRFTRDDARVREIVGGLSGDVLDLGCGEGPYDALLAPLAEAGRIRYTGLEPHAQRVSQLRRRWPWAELITSTAERLSDDETFAQRRFDHLLVLRSWNHLESPARVAQQARERSGGVTGTGYEQGSRITGPFDMAGGKVTGTEQFRFDRRGAQLSRGPVQAAPVSVDEDARPVSRVTGEGISAGLKITGDDWDRGQRVTGTEGASARRRNPTRPGSMTPMPGSAMPAVQPKRNESLPEPVSRVTGSSGNTQAGSLITVSGGARG